MTDEVRLAAVPPERAPPMLPPPVCPPDGGLDPAPAMLRLVTWRIRAAPRWNLEARRHQMLSPRSGVWARARVCVCACL